MEKPTSQWSRSAFRTTCISDTFVNNHCEIFNNSIREYRDLPIIGLLQGLHKSAMKRIQTRRDKMAKSYALNPICPNAMRKVNNKYLVTMTEGGHEIVVDLDARTCACRKFDLTGLPCYHACACIHWKNLKLVDFIHTAYSKDMYLACYQHTVEPITSEQYWEKTGIPGPLPPVFKVQPGRPKKSRNKKNDVPADQTKLTRKNLFVFCSYCKERDHNARTCPAKQMVLFMLRKKNAELVASRIMKQRVSKTKETPEPTKTPDPIPQIEVQGYNQGGVFTSYTQPSRVENAPLGIQPQRFLVRGQYMTTLKQIEAEASARKSALGKRPPWRN
ncbi:hypothetical protein DCAR_0311171 [Daucus carota subsp. sativus]|uniref:SWIM-type domain-containing protein n=1 Tax=Daucus carota subsp. sativus TaxID=79200 RepID=A0AAF0WNN0_DAUCS|nr:hypothetical protein DCAR_0311171 [Daucus carota subsp. sativus]